MRNEEDLKLTSVTSDPSEGHVKRPTPCESVKFLEIFTVGIENNISDKLGLSSLIFEY